MACSWPSPMHVQPAISPILLSNNVSKHMKTKWLDMLVELKTSEIEDAYSPGTISLWFYFVFTFPYRSVATLICFLLRQPHCFHVLSHSYLNFHFRHQILCIYIFCHIPSYNWHAYQQNTIYLSTWLERLANENASPGRTDQVREEGRFLKESIYPREFIT